MNKIIEESGQGMVEYALLIILIAIIVVVSLTILGNSGVRSIYEGIVTLFP